MLYQEFDYNSKKPVYFKSVWLEQVSGTETSLHTYRWGLIQRCVRTTSVSSGRMLMVCDSDQSAPAPPSGWRCLTETQSLSPERHVQLHRCMRGRKRKIKGYIYIPQTHLVCGDLWRGLLDAQLSALLSPNLRIAGARPNKHQSHADPENWISV